MVFVIGCLSIRRVAAPVIDEDGRRPGAVLCLNHTIVILRSTVIAIAGVDTDALALFIKLTAKASGINRTLRSLQGPNVINCISAICREIRVSEFDYATVVAGATFE
jgi:hypothetical protein